MYHDEAYQKGYTAGGTGQGLDTNPYTRETEAEKWHSWRSGHYTGKSLAKMTPVYKCENSHCPYGEHWDKGLPDPHAGKDRPLEARADAYSQDPGYRKDGRLPWNGFCLNCIDDSQRFEEESYNYAF